MADKSAIEWTDATSIRTIAQNQSGCDNCYAQISERFRGVPGHPFESGFDLTLRPERLLQPLD
jgi:protein gp37